MAEVWRSHNPSYIEAFYEIHDPLERVEQLISHEDELTKDIPLIAFKRRRDTSFGRQVENVMTLCHSSP